MNYIYKNRLVRNIFIRLGYQAWVTTRQKGEINGNPAYRVFLNRQSVCLDFKIPESKSSLERALEQKEWTINLIDIAETDIRCDEWSVDNKYTEREHIGDYYVDGLKETKVSNFCACEEEIVGVSTIDGLETITIDIDGYRERMISIESVLKKIADFS